MKQMQEANKSSKLADEVVVDLQQQISLGKYKEGEKIPAEPELMKTYGVGRSTIREAIKTLASTGILKVRQGSGTYINARPSHSESLDVRLRRSRLKEVNDVRFLLEKEIIRLATSNRTIKDIKTMRKALDDRTAALYKNDYEACADADIRLHTAIASASHNSVLADLYKTFTHTIRDFFNKRGSADISKFAATHVLHVQLTDAIINKDAKAATLITETLLKNNY
ncbi:FadR/GntR family transcriptional regulator [Danxiaibacter flavus]|uniref:FadR/GntR family transcriptional regulator n=1 Tax=Danxiaibacter flavus TaxID=3049108 RepID=A0ABV3ZNW3_9BACT|nr:FadR/GntR family transcriptional regulator [Chitinophagaceae bacterium DXS]